MDFSKRKMALAVAGVVTLGAVAGCGGSDFADRPVGEIQDAAVKDMKALESLKMEGSITQAAGDLELAMSVNTDGQCRGTLTTAGASAEIISTTDASYIKADEAFWANTTGGEEQGKAIMKMIGDKWAKLPAGEEGFSSICDLDELLKDLGDDKDEKKATKGDTSEVDGTEAIEIIQKDGDETTTTWVATEGEHYILKMEKKGGDESGSFTFSEFDEPVEVKEPAPADVVDLGAAA